MSSPEDLLEEARSLGIDQQDRARQLWQRVASGPPGATWSIAHVDLAIHDYGDGEYEAALAHLETVLSAPADRVDLAARAVAGVLAAISLEALGRSVSLPALESSIEDCLAHARPTYAGTGLELVARIRESQGHRASAKAALTRAAEILDVSDPIRGGANARLVLARLEAQDGDDAQARQQIAVALEHLASLPGIAPSRRLTEHKLITLRDSLRNRP